MSSANDLVSYRYWVILHFGTGSNPELYSVPQIFKDKQKEKCFGNNKNVLFLNYKIIEQEMNKIAIHTHVIFRPCNAMFSLSKTYVFPNWQ